MAVDLAVLLAFAFGAGMVAFFAPCCAAMLPAYVSFTLGRVDPRGAEPPRQALPRRRREAGALALWSGLIVGALGLSRLALEAFGLGGGDRSFNVLTAVVGIGLAIAGVTVTAPARALRSGVAFGGLATAGLLAVFVAVGLPIAAVAPSAVAALGYLAVAVGLGLVAVGLLTLAGRHIPVPIRSFSPERRGPLGFFLFGIAYGLASLSCTFPIFLSVVALSALSGTAAAVLAFAAYALGKGSLMVLVSVLATASPAAVEGRMRKLMPQFDKAMAAVTIAAGAFIAYYFGVVYVAP
jgi:cytochrome c biogenesis protein CcdA